MISRNFKTSEISWISKFHSDANQFGPNQLIDLETDNPITNRTRTFDWLLYRCLVPRQHWSISGSRKLIYTVQSLHYVKCRWIMHYWSRIIDSIQEGDNNMVKDKVIQISDFNPAHVIGLFWCHFPRPHLSFKTKIVHSFYEQNSNLTTV